MIDSPNTHMAQGETASPVGKGVAATTVAMASIAREVKIDLTFIVSEK